MIFIREDQKFGRNVDFLGNGERHDALGVRNAEILLAVDEQGRRFPIGDLIHWIPFFRIGVTSRAAVNVLKKFVMGVDLARLYDKAIGIRSAGLFIVQPLDFPRHQLFDQIRQIRIQPLLDHRAHQAAGQVFQRSAAAR